MYHGVLGWFGGIGTTLYSALFYPILLWVVIHLLKRITTTLPLFQAWLGDDENRPVEIGWVTISWYTTSLNRTFRYLGQHPILSKFFAVWFNAGVVFGTVGMFSSVLLLLYNLYHTLAMPQEVHPLTPILPGVNLPHSQLLYYFIALFVSGVFHEFGHAIAAVVEGLPVEGFGLFITLAYPGAYVNLQSAYFETLSIQSTLRVVCAGVWHNAVLAAIALLLLQPGAGPFIASPLFENVEDGVIVAYVDEVYQDITPYSKIIQVNECKVTGYNSWVSCFFHMKESNFSVVSYCASFDPKEEEKETTECCNPQYNGPLMCWEVQANTEANVEHGGEPKRKKFCYSASALVTQDYCLPPSSNRIEDEYRKELEKYEHYHSECPEGQRCFTPLLPQPELLIEVKMEDSSTGKITTSLSAGHPFHLYQSVHVTEYRVRFSWLRFLIPPHLPSTIQQILHYICSISGALAILNIAPVYLLDGEHACKKVLQYIFLQQRRWGGHDMTLRRGLVPFWSATIFKLTLALLSVNIILSLSALSR